MAKQQSRRWASTPRYPRTARVNEVLREIIAEELERDPDDDGRLYMVTITGVDVDKDFGKATIYFSALGNDAPLEEVTAALESRRVPFQAAVGRNVRLKRTPQLRFVPDLGIIEGQKLEGLLRQLPPRLPEDEVLPDASVYETKKRIVDEDES